MIHDQEDYVKSTCEIDIAHLRQLHMATTQGEWYCEFAAVWNRNSEDAADDLLVDCGTCDTSNVEGDANAAFAAAAHNAMPALLDELERLRDANKMLVGALKIASAECDQLRDSLRELIDENGPCSYNAARQKARDLIFGN